jgi:hypothetical protein
MNGTTARAVMDQVTYQKAKAVTNGRTGAGLKTVVKKIK